MNIIDKNNKTTEKRTSFLVFWLENGEPNAEIFLGNNAKEALSKCEEIRGRAKTDASIAHVCISSDMVDNVSVPGVSDKLPNDYSWTMRRRNFVPGRASGSL